MLTAILVDGSFYIKRYRALIGKDVPAIQVAKDLYTMCLAHLTAHHKGKSNDLYRILFYDCEPISKKAHNPVNNKPIDFSKSREYLFRMELYSELRKLRKVALRLGYLHDNNEWIIKPEITKKLLQRKITVDDVTEEDVRYSVNQKAVDMKIGLDIASLSLKKLVGQIILISGDSDFVPAAKMARREGIDFILDPMNNRIKPDLHEHIDGLKSTYHKLGGFMPKSGKS